MAQAKEPITIAPQPLSAALYEFGSLTSRQVMFTPGLTASKTTRGVTGASDEKIALAQLLEGTGLTFRREGDIYMIVQAGEGGVPQSDSAAGGGATVEALIVTAQKREENIQDVPIAISAFSSKELDAQKIEGGFDLLKAIPNVTFSKNNFTSYNFSIRGVGTKAISATTDPGVAVAFNNTTIIQNRLFEQEYFDVERVEVLRGPQGTLYGRNATSGVINVISAKPKLYGFEATAKGELGNYDATRLSGMVNIPIVEDKLAVRLAGAWTKRDGYDFNTVTGHAVNGRDLWSTRLSVGFEPNDVFRGDAIWEHFEEDDNRSRTGKQLCKHDPGPEFINGVSVEDTYTFDLIPVAVRRAIFSQGCLPVNLYDDEAFQTPNGLALPFVSGTIILSNLFNIGPGGGRSFNVSIQPVDPYGNMLQSRDLRKIASVRDPVYRAKADLYELNLDFDLTPELTLYSQTAYVEDETYSFQDYNRFNSLPVFTDTSLLNPSSYGDFRGLAPRPEGSPVGTAGVFCDPQIGCSDTIAGFDIAQAKATQFSQEIRLQSDFDGPVNFSLGANYTRFETLIDYYVFFNVLTAVASSPPLYGMTPTAIVDSDYYGDTCLTSILPGTGAPDAEAPTTDPDSFCVYIDPNPVESIDGNGHNYFRSKNPYRLKSWAAFGEAYWNLRENLKLTLGLRYTDDTKRTIPVPTQALLAKSAYAGGYVSSGYPELDPVVQDWQEWTGRLVLDWKPELSFTDSTLIYGSYSHGYKGGGSNPPSPGFATREQMLQIMADQGFPEATIELTDTFKGGIWPVLELTAVNYQPTFEPEFVDAFEIGTKNTLLGGAMTLNLTGFYYDYKDYQVSQIRDRTAVNENFDAKTWGLELETMFAPSRNFQIIWNLGYLDTEIGDGETSIDIMNRTQGIIDEETGEPKYVIVKPWVQLPSNCVIPAEYMALWLDFTDSYIGYPFLCGGVRGALLLFGNPPPDDPNFPGAPYDPANYPELNGGAGILAQLGGNELPNAPHWTTNLGAQYSFDLPQEWRLTIRGDAYWQSQSWARVYNLDPYDKLHGWYNANVSMTVENEELGLTIEGYVKNLLNDTPITDAFLNSDDTALTTNVFVLDPRLYGLSIRKTF